MATANTVQILSLTPTTPTANTADATGNYFTPVGSQPHYLEVTNGSGGSVTLTVDDPTTQGPAAATAFNADAAVVVPASGVRLVKLDPARFTNPATGVVNLAWSAATSVTYKLYA